MPDKVMHLERGNPNFSACGKNTFTTHIITTKDTSRVTCENCEAIIKKRRK